MGQEFSPEQKRWLEGFASGAAAVRSLPPRGTPAAAEPSGPDADLLKAQDRTTAAGKKLVDQEKWKRSEHPLEAYGRLRDEALTGAKPKPEDNFRWRYHGLFYVAPAQDAFMCRLRFPGGILAHVQFRGVADLAEQFGGGLRRRHHPRQPPDPRDRPRHTADVLDGPARPRHHQPRRRRRQHPQRHRLADRRHRPGRADRHPPARQGDAPLHPQPPRAVRPAAQVQHRLRRRRRDRARSKTPTTSASGASRSAEGAPVADRGICVSACARRHHGPQGLRPRHRRARSRPTSASRSPPRSCASSSSTATAPTARRPGSSTCSTAGASRSSSPRWRRSSAARCRASRSTSVRAAARPSTARPHRLPPAEAAGPVLRRRRAAGRPHDRRADARPRRHRPAISAAATIRLTVWQNLLDLRHAARNRVADVKRAHRGTRPCTGLRRTCGPGSSPAPATPAASSPLSDTKGHALADRRAPRVRASSSTSRSTST